MAKSLKSPKLTAAAVKREVAALADPEKAKFLQRFFRTGAGEYAEGDQLLGLTVPDQRVVAKAFRELPLAELEKLLASKFHEHRLIGLIILCDQHARATEEAKRLEWCRFYLEHLEGVNNWDLVDASAAEMVGTHLNGKRKMLEGLVASPVMWHRRIAIVSTFAELRAGRTALTFWVAERPACGQAGPDSQGCRVAAARGGKAIARRTPRFSAETLCTATANHVAIRDRAAGCIGQEAMAERPLLTVFLPDMQ